MKLEKEKLLYTWPEFEAKFLNKDAKYFNEFVDSCKQLGNSIEKAICEGISVKDKV